MEEQNSYLTLLSVKILKNLTVDLDDIVNLKTMN